MSVICALCNSGQYLFMLYLMTVSLYREAQCTHHVTYIRSTDTNALICLLQNLMLISNMQTVLHHRNAHG
jgi:hypothetical protein